MTIQNVNYGALIQNASKKYGVPADLIEAVIKTESSGNPAAASGTGPVGLMQVSKALAKDYGYDLNDRLDPAKNIEMGTRYLAQNLKAFGGDTTKALLGYNQGTGGARQMLAGKKPMADEGWKYINNPNYAAFTKPLNANSAPQTTSGIANPVAALAASKPDNQFSPALLNREAAAAAPTNAQAMAGAATPIESMSTDPQANPERENQWGDAALAALSMLGGMGGKNRTTTSMSLGGGGPSSWNKDTSSVLRMLNTIGSPTWLRQ